MKPRKNNPTGIRVKQRDDYNGYMRQYRKLGPKAARLVDINATRRKMGLKPLLKGGTG